MAVEEFVSEDHVNTFEGWLTYQAVDAATTSQDELARWRTLYDELRTSSLASPKGGVDETPGNLRRT
jgi:hypothetical protein